MKNLFETKQDKLDRLGDFIAIFLAVGIFVGIILSIK
jgi:hypothetical protein